MRNYPVNPPRTSKKLADGFEVKPADNGGWLILTRLEPGAFGTTYGAFTYTEDLIDFLTDELNGE
jgi:hypothetical protein